MQSSLVVLLAAYFVNMSSTVAVASKQPEDAGHHRHLRRQTLNGDAILPSSRLLKKECPAVVGSCGTSEDPGDEFPLKCGVCYYAGSCEATKAGYDVDSDCKITKRNNPGQVYHTATPTMMPTTSPTVGCIDDASDVAAFWFYVDGQGATKGPVLFDAMKLLYESGSVIDSTFVWNGSTVSQWTPLSQLQLCFL